MGDLRNKMSKLARDEAHRRFMAERYPPKPIPPHPRCRCGNSHYETTIWAHRRGYWAPTEFYCTGCIPADLAGEFAMVVANLPDA